MHLVFEAILIWSYDGAFLAIFESTSSCVQFTTLVHISALERMYGSILTTYSIFRHCGAQDMQLEEMERTGLFPKSNVWFGADFRQINFVLPCI